MTVINKIINSTLYNGKMLIVGKRGDLYWKKALFIHEHSLLWKKSKLHSGSGIDYFIFTHNTFNNKDKIILNEIIVGRIRYDNIILSLALKDNNINVIDGTNYIQAIHLSILPKAKSEIIKV